MYDFQRTVFFKRATGYGPSLDVDPCQTPGLSFEACIEAMRIANTSMRMPSQMRYFCEPDESCRATSGCNVSATCNLQEALYVLSADYLLVGITEEFDLTVAMLEYLLPWHFQNASRLSGVRRNAAVANHTRHVPHNSTTFKTISALAVNFAEEMLFYDAAKYLFLHKNVQMQAALRKSAEGKG